MLNGDTMILLNAQKKFNKHRLNSRLPTVNRIQFNKMFKSFQKSDHHVSILFQCMLVCNLSRLQSFPVLDYTKCCRTFDINHIENHLDLFSQIEISVGNARNTHSDVQFSIMQTEYWAGNMSQLGINISIDLLIEIRSLRDH